MEAESSEAIHFFVRLNREGRNSHYSPAPILLSVWTEAAHRPNYTYILYYLLREREQGFLQHSNERSSGDKVETIVREMTSKRIIELFYGRIEI